MLFGREFHQIEAKIKKALALVEDSQMLFGPGTSNRFCSLEFNFFWGTYKEMHFPRYKTRNMNLELHFKMSSKYVRYHGSCYTKPNWLHFRVALEQY